MIFNEESVFEEAVIKSLIEYMGKRSTKTPIREGLAEKLGKYSLQ